MADEIRWYIPPYAPMHEQTPVDAAGLVRTGAIVMLNGRPARIVAYVNEPVFVVEHTDGTRGVVSRGSVLFAEYDQLKQLAGAAWPAREED